MFENSEFKSQVMNLWRICFPDDTEDFIRFYFDRKYKQEYTLTYQVDGKIVSSLQLLPYSIAFYNSEIATSYISGAGTHPDYQSQGIMAKLLKESFEEMIRKEVAIATLIPANTGLYGYYGKFGFAAVFDYKEECYPIEQISGKLITTSKYEISESSPEAAEIYSYFNKKELERPFSILHTEEDLKIILGDLRLSNGKVFIVRNTFSGHICGLAFVEFAEKEAIIKEIMTDSEGEKNLILLSIAEKYGNIDSIIIRNIPCSEPKKHLGMARIINVEKLLSLYAREFPSVSFHIEIADPDIKNNDAIYLIDKGTCKKTEKKNTDETMLKFSIGQFTQLILGYSNEFPNNIKELFPVSTPFMSLMLN
jgi:predicted acetyltransferase